jgi:pyridoxal phosphate enzyme (YggS family)
VSAGESRRAELVAALGAVRSRIAAACEGVGRDPRAVTMVAVTKTHPATDVVALLDLGVLDIGENRDLEARAKAAEVDALLASAGAGPRPRWHFVGQVQTRKCRSITRYATAVHSLDRAELVGLLADGVARAERDPLEVFVQVSLDGDPARGGAPPEQVPALADTVVSHQTLHLRGVMAVAPIGVEPARAFADLAEVSRQLRERHPAAGEISAGMSADLEAALENGATYVRVGSALLGRRRADIG